MEKCIPTLKRVRNLLAYLPSTILQSAPETSQVVPTPGKTASLTLQYVLTAPADLHYIISPSGNPAPTATEIKQFASGQREPVGDEKSMRSGSVKSDRASKLSFEVENLESDTSYDTYFVAEATGSNGVFGKIASVLKVATYAAAPAISSFDCEPQSGSENALTLRFKTDRRGNVHYAACLKPLSFEVGTLVEWTAAFRDCISGSIVIDQSEQEISYNVSNLLSGTQYNVVLVGEAPETGGVIGNPTTPVSTVTHKLPPKLQQLQWLPENGSSTSALVSFSTNDPTPFILHYIVAPADAKGLLGDPRTVFESTKRSTAAPEITARGSIRSTEMLQDPTYHFNVNALSPGQEYQLYLAVETLDSNGVIKSPNGDGKATSWRCKVNSEAPKIENSVLVPCTGRTDCIHLDVNASGPGEIYYMILDEKKKQSIATSEDFFAFEDAKQRGGGVLNVTEEGSGHFQMQINDLEPSTNYIGYLIAETSNSFGVYSKLYSHPAVSDLRTCTNDLASNATLTHIGPIPGTIDELVVRLQIPDPMTVFYSLSTTSSNTNGSILCDSKPKAGLKPGECQFVVSNLTAGTNYHFDMYTETEQGVRGDWNTVEQPQATTHSYPPAVNHFSSSALNGSEDALILTANLNSTGVLHTVVFEEGSAKSLDMLEKLIECSKKAGQDNTPCKPPQLHYNALAGSEIEIVHDNLKPDTNYTVLYLTEAISGSEVYGYMSSKCLTLKKPVTEDEVFTSKVTTHATAPKIIKMSAAPYNATIDSIFVNVELDRCGLVHYTISDTDFKDPVRISASTMRPRFARYGTLNATNLNQTCFGNLTIDGLENNKTYHVTALSETVNSHGVFGTTRYPSNDVSLVVTTHATAPVFNKVAIEPTAFDATTLSLNLSLSHHGLVHYVLFLRELNTTLKGLSIQEPNDTKAHTLLISNLNLAQLKPSEIREASKNTSDFFGSGVVLNNTLDISRQDIHDGKETFKKLEKLLPGTLYELCVVAETPDSNGVYGPIKCKRVRTYSDYTSVQDNHDRIQLFPIAARTDALTLRYTMEKVQGIPLNETLSLGALGAATGRIPFFVLYSDRSKPSSGKAVLESRLGQRSVAASGLLTDLVDQNETHLTLEKSIDQLSSNHEYTAYVVSQSFDSEFQSMGKVSSVSPNTTASIFTHADAPRLVEYNVAPTDSSRTGITVDVVLDEGENRPGQTRRGWVVHVVVVSKSCSNLPSRETLVSVLESLHRDKPPPTKFMACIAAVFSRHVAFPSNKKASWDLLVESPGQVVKNETNGTLTFGEIVLDTEYDIYLGTETSESDGVYSNFFTPPIALRTHANAPVFESLSVQPKPSSTSELLLQFQLPRESHVHFVVAEAGEVNETCSTARHIRESRSLHSSSNKEDNCSTVKTKMYRQSDVDLGLVGINVKETIGYLNPNTSYDVFVVSESWESKGVVTETFGFYNISTHAVAPILMSLAAFPTPGDPFSITVSYRMNTHGVLHILIVQEDNHDPIELNSIVEPTGFLAATAIAQLSIAVNQSDTELLQIVRVPVSGASYSVHLVTETRESHGVYGSVATLANIRTHDHPPQVLNFSVMALDATTDGLTATACLPTAGHVHVLVMQKGSTAPVMKNLNATIPGLLVKKNITISETCGTINITALQDDTVYEIYYVPESYNSFGVLGEMSQVATRVKTHGTAPSLIEDIECTMSPNCQELGREEVSCCIR